MSTWTNLRRTTFALAAIFVFSLARESNQHSKRPGFWKMNVSLLEDPNILKELRQNIPVSKTTGSDILSYKRYIWDWLYNNIRNHANFVLENMLWKKTYNTYTRRPKKTKNKKTKLNKTKKRWTLPTLIIRARARWHEHGERIKVYTNYFLTLQKLTHVRKHIRKLLISGSITSYPFYFWDTD